MHSCPLADRCEQNERTGTAARDDPPELETRLYCLTGECDNCPVLTEASLLTGGMFPEAARLRNGHFPAVPRTANRTSDKSDLGLVENAQAGDEGAFEELMARHTSAVLRYAYRILDDVEDALDTAQEVFIRVYRKLDTFDLAKARSADRHAVAAWLLTIAHHVAYDRRRWLNRRPTEPLSALLDAPPLAGSDVVNEATTHELGECLAHAMDELPAPQRTALELCEGQGMSYDEAAAAMHCSTKSVEMRLYRGKQQLRKHLRFALGWHGEH